MMLKDHIVKKTQHIFSTNAHALHPMQTFFQQQIPVPL